MCSDIRSVVLDIVLQLESFFVRFFSKPDCLRAKQSPFQTLILILMLGPFCGVFANFALAGNSFGNGGDAIVCRDSQGKITKAELLDYFELVTLQNGRVDLGPDRLSEFEKVNLVLNRLERVNPSRAHIYRQGLNTFFSEVAFVNEALEDVKDSGDLILPRDCGLEQVAIQITCPDGSMNNPYSCYGRASENYYNWTPLFKGRYTVNKPIWQKMDTNSRAGLILHELIYREASSLMHHKNSINVRRLNALLISADFQNLTQSMYNQFLIDHDFGVFDVDHFYNNEKQTYFVVHHWYAGLRYDNPLEFYANGQLRRAYAHYNGEPKDPVPFWRNGKMFLIDARVIEQESLVTEEGYRFNENGQILGLKVDTARGSPLYPFAFGGQIHQVESFRISEQDSGFKSTTFRKTGIESCKFLDQISRFGSLDQVQSFTFNEFGALISGAVTDPLAIHRQTYEIVVAPASQVTTNHQANVLRLTSQASGWVQNRRVKLTSQFRHAILNFDEQGELLSASPRSDVEGSMVEGMIRFNSTSVRSFKHRISLFENPTTKSTAFFIDWITVPLTCVYQGRTYKVQENLHINKMAHPEGSSERLMIKSAKELPILSAENYCAVIGD